MMKVVAAFIEREGKVFMVRRPFHKKRGGLWEFPGGKVEEGESPEDALKREIKEELGIEVVPLEIISRCKHIYPDEFIELILIKAHTEGEPSPKEAIEARWIEIEEITTLELCPADRSILEGLKLEKIQKPVNFD
ncbi:MAG: (deoxy)nucleoside triphosphate pyrophosphohydrolase [Caldimicrobium sp.]|nr:(deoxy)nucleoside triphosphate pyrophosphohydrolase [Caldimicrobium sp.]